MKRRPAPPPEPPKPARGRPPLADAVKMIRATAKDVCRFELSENVVAKLITLRDARYPQMPYITPDHRFMFLRLQFAKFADIGMPAVFVHLEPPVYDPRPGGSRSLVRARNGRRFQTQIKGSLIGVKPDWPTTDLTLLWADQQGNPMQGLVLIFPDDAMTYPGPKSIVPDNLVVR